MIGKKCRVVFAMPAVLLGLLGSAVVTGLGASPAGAVTRQPDFTTYVTPGALHPTTVIYSCYANDPNAPFIEGVAPDRTSPKEFSLYSLFVTRSDATPAEAAVVYDPHTNSFIAGYTAESVTYRNYGLTNEPTTTKLFCTDNVNDAWR